MCFVPSGAWRYWCIMDCTSCYWLIWISHYPLLHKIEFALISYYNDASRNSSNVELLLFVLSVFFFIRFNDQRNSCFLDFPYPLLFLWSIKLLKKTGLIFQRFQWRRIDWLPGMCTAFCILLYCSCYRWSWTNQQCVKLVILTFLQYFLGSIFH